jgi:hypothetical protein
MKNERERTNELNMLSAYLDNALKEKEVKVLETRLERDAELRNKLENLRQTKILLSRLNRVRAPRNYTLKPDMVTVRRQKRKPLFSTLRLASSFAAILLVALFGVQLLLSGQFIPTAMMAEAPAMESAPAADETTPEPLILWAEPGAGGSDSEGYGGGGPESMAEESFILEEPVTEEEMASEEQPEILPESDLAPQESPEIDSAPADKNLEDESPILGINPEQSGQVLERSEPGPEDQAEPIAWTKLIQWTQIGLAAIALGGGVTLWILHKKG